MRNPNRGLPVDPSAHRNALNQDAFRPHAHEQTTGEKNYHRKGYGGLLRKLSRRLSVWEAVKPDLPDSVVADFNSLATDAKIKTVRMQFQNPISDYWTSSLDDLKD